MAPSNQAVEVVERLQEQQDHLHEVRYGLDATDRREAEEEKRRVARFIKSLAQSGLTIQSIQNS